MSRSKKGQVGIFVIVAIVIVAAVLVLYLYRPGPLGPRSADTTDPVKFLQSCLEPGLGREVATLAAQGGTAVPLGFTVYNETKVPYFCYTSEYYKTCVVQQPNIQGAFERSLNEELADDVEVCMTSLREEFESRGYSVSGGKGKVNSSFVPGTLTVRIQAPLTLSKDVTRTYREFELSYSSQLYDLMAIATSILEFESTYGDSETTLYLRSYPDLKIEKLKQSDGTKIYTVSNVVSGEQFRFASRSLAWPPGGYGFT